MGSKSQLLTRNQHGKINTEKEMVLWLRFIFYYSGG
jgi:hypothetical protein